MSKVNFDTINIGFGNLADEYDRLQQTNRSVQIMREKYYEVVLKTISPPADLLELNCGSGIDAHFIAAKGYNILATDISDKMLNNAQAKGKKENLKFKKLSFTGLNNLGNQKFDAVVSNLGGINCIDDLSNVNKGVNSVLKSNGYFIATVMPHLFLWENLLLFKGEFKRAFRRLNKKGIFSNAGNEKVFVKYYSPKELVENFSANFELIGTKALRIFAPPPTANYWYKNHSSITALLDNLDNTFEDFYPASFVCDNFIAVFQKR